MAEKGTNPNGIHDGHRERIFSGYLSVNAHELSDYKLLEMLLYSLIPRGDTCYIARGLLEKFGLLDAVLDADCAQLIEVNGIGEAAAARLCLLGELRKMMYDNLIEDPDDDSTDPTYSVEWVK